MINLEQVMINFEQVMTNCEEVMTNFEQVKLVYRVNMLTAKSLSYDFIMSGHVLYTIQAMLVKHPEYSWQDDMTQ